MKIVLSNKQRTWSIFVLLFIYVVYQLLVLAPLSFQFKELTGQLQILDLNFYAFHKSVLADLELYGEVGRTAYLSLMWADIIYPVIYGLLFTLLLQSFLPYVHPENKKFQKLTFLPLIIVLIDYCENLSFYLLIKQFDNRPEVLDILASLFNSLKWTLVAIVLSVLIYSIAIRIKVDYFMGKSK